MKNRITISGTKIRILNGLYSLNDLHKASGRLKKHQPSNWLRNQQAIDLIGFLKNEESKAGIPAIQSKQGVGTFVCKELVVHYGMWISPEFSLQVIRTFLDVRGNDKTTTDQRTPLRDAVNMLVGKKGLMYPEAYSVIHQRFNVKHIDELSADQVPIAIEYVHKLTLEVEWLPDQKKKLVEKQPEKVLHNLECLIAQMYFLRGWWDKFGPAISGLNPRVASSISGLFHDGWFIASGVAQELKLPTPDKEYIKHYPWDADCREQNEYYLANKK